MWLAVVQEIQTDVYIKFNSIHLHHFPKDRQVREHQLNNEKTIEKYNRGELSQYEFIKSMAFNYTKNVNSN